MESSPAIWELVWAQTKLNILRTPQSFW